MEPDLPLFLCNKIVKAIRIASIEQCPDGQLRVTSEPTEGNGGVYTVFPKSDWSSLYKGTPEDKGYYVKYQDGYESWSPSAPFEQGYINLGGGSSFGKALVALEKGFKVAREGWNGKGMFIVMMPGLYLPPYNSQEPGAKVNDRTAKHIGEDAPLDSQPYFAMLTAKGQWQPGWLASQADMLAKDWVVLD